MIESNDDQNISVFIDYVRIPVFLGSLGDSKSEGIGPIHRNIKLEKLDYSKVITGNFGFCS